MLLTELSIDLQIHICEFLRPLEIIALRQTAKVFQQVTAQRIIWIHALIRICHQNSLFLPTFPISDMSDTELEHAATAPFRWIALSSSQGRDDDGYFKLPSRSIRVIKGLFPQCLSDPEEDDEFYYPLDLYLVPGGRYLVARGPRYLSVLDLRCASAGGMSPDGEKTKVWTALEVTLGFVVHPTPDGLGIRILTHSDGGVLHVFEIYPQQENPKLARIAEIVLNLRRAYLDCFLHGDRAVIYSCLEKFVIVWDFITNTMASWSVSIPATVAAAITSKVIKVTETAITILSVSACPFIWEFHIPPLISRTPLFDVERDIPEVAPIFTFEYPGLKQGTVYSCQSPDCWYSGNLSSLPFYLVFETRRRRKGDVKVNVGLCKLEFSPDLSNLSLTTIASTPIPLQTGQERIHERMITYRYRVCDDRSVLFNHRLDRLEAITVGIEPSSDSSRTPTTHINTTTFAHTYASRNFCPASARLVHRDMQDLVISDFS